MRAKLGNKEKAIIAFMLLLSTAFNAAIIYLAFQSIWEALCK